MWYVLMPLPLVFNPYFPSAFHFQFATDCGTKVWKFRTGLPKMCFFGLWIIFS